MQRRDKVAKNLLVIGNTGSGKTTMIDHLFYKCSGIHQRVSEKILESTPSGSNMEHAQVLEKLKKAGLLDSEGIIKGQDTDKLETINSVFAPIEAPLHKEFIKCMIIGKSLPDIVLLMVSSLQDEFEDGIFNDKQTCEHLIVTTILGIKNIIVCVNKMDNAPVNWSEESFNKIKVGVSTYLKNIGYHPKDVPFIPVSGLLGDNINEKSSNLSWFKGPDLLTVLDGMTLPQRPVKNPLRFSVQDRYKIGGIGTVVIGRVDSGILNQGIDVTISPTGISSMVRSMEKDFLSLEEAFPGDYLGINLKNIAFNDIRRGNIIGNASHDPPREVSSFLAQIFILNFPSRIFKGYCPVIQCHNAYVACKFADFKCTIDRATGDVIEEAPKFLKTGDTCLVTLIPAKPLCVEAYSDYPSLGRFVVKDMRQIIAVGIIKSVEKKETKKGKEPAKKRQ